MVQADKPLVTLTGISGYLGSQTCLEFLKDGGFRVRGTVRDKTNEAKIAPIREAFGEFFDQVELVEADMENEESIMNAVAGSTYVIHMASPYTFSGPAESIIGPAVNGTNSAMKACKAAGVRRVVITSSVAAIFAQVTPPADLTYDESIWNDLEAGAMRNSYVRSKYEAEKAAWNF